MIDVTLQKNVIVHDGSFAGKSGSYNKIPFLMEGIKSIRIRCISGLIDRRIKKFEAIGFKLSQVVVEKSDEDLDFAQYEMVRV